LVEMTTRSGSAKLVAVSLVSVTMLLSLCLGNGGPAMVGEAAPDFTVLDVDDVAHNLTDYRGRVLVVDFFTTWCGPCADQLSVMKDLRDDLPEEDVAFLLIDQDDRESQEKVAKYRDDNAIGWPVAYNGGDVGTDYGVDAIPTTVVIDGDGIVRYYHTGTTSKSELKEAIEDLL
jgi:peroxiredoxin